MPRGKFFYFCYAIILVLVIIFLMNQVQFIFRPFVIAFQTLFFPFLVAGMLFYLFRPLIELLTKRKIPRVISILILFLALIGILVAVSMMIGPILQNQINRLIDNAPQIAEALRQQWVDFETNRAQFPDYMKELINMVTIKAQEMFTGIGSHLAGLLSLVTNLIVIIITVPFILFYMLKDGKQAPLQIFQFLPEEGRKEGLAILADMNKALSTYVQGQVIVSLCVGVMVYIGYLIIGLEYSLVLALVAMFTNVIPFIGPFIGIVPALIVGFIDSPMMMGMVIIVVLVAQQIESNFISPQIMGRALDIHPLTIILLLLVASSLGGILGLIIAVPTYAIIKVIGKHCYRLYRLKQEITR